MLARGEKVIKVVIPPPECYDGAPAGGPYVIGDTLPFWPSWANLAHKIGEKCHPVRTQEHRWDVGIWDCACRYRPFNPPDPELIAKHTERPVVSHGWPTDRSTEPSHQGLA